MFTAETQMNKGILTEYCVFLHLLFSIHTILFCTVIREINFRGNSHFARRKSMLFTHEKKLMKREKASERRKDEIMAEGK
jgi:hypothetical protein